MEQAVNLASQETPVHGTNGTNQETGSIRTLQYQANMVYDEAPRLIDEERNSSVTGMTQKQGDQSNNMTQQSLPGTHRTTELVVENDNQHSVEQKSAEGEVKISVEVPEFQAQSIESQEKKSSQPQMIIQDNTQSNTGQYEVDKDKLLVTLGSSESAQQMEKKQSEGVRKSIFTESEIESNAQLNAEKANQTNFMSNEALYKSENNPKSSMNARSSNDNTPMNLVSQSDQPTEDSNILIQKGTTSIEQKHYVKNGDIIEEEADIIHTHRSDDKANLEDKERLQTAGDNIDKLDELQFFEANKRVSVRIIETLPVHENSVIKEQASKEDEDSQVQLNSTIEQINKAPESIAVMANDSGLISFHGVSSSASPIPNTNRKRRGYRNKLEPSGPIVAIRANIQQDSQKFVKANQKLADAFFSNAESQNSGPTAGQSTREHAVEDSLDQNMSAVDKWQTSQDQAAEKQTSHDFGNISRINQNVLSNSLEQQQYHDMFDQRQMNLIIQNSPQNDFALPQQYSGIHASYDSRFTRQQPMAVFAASEQQQVSRLLANATQMPDEYPMRYKNGQALQPLSQIARNQKGNYTDGLTNLYENNYAQQMSQGQKTQIQQLQKMYQKRQGSLPQEPSMKLAKRNRPGRSKPHPDVNVTSLSSIPYDQSPDFANSRFSSNKVVKLHPQLMNEHTGYTREIPTTMLYQTNEQGGVKVDTNFNLLSFIMQNNLQSLVPSGHDTLQDFHRHSKVTRSVQKNFDSDLVMNSNMSPKMNSQLRRGGNFSYSTTNQTMLTDRTRKKQHAQAQFEQGLQTGIFNIEQAYSLIQTIRNKAGRPMMTDEDICDYLRSKNLISHSISFDDREVQIKQYKWREVMKFMQNNPHILLQLLSLGDAPTLGPWLRNTNKSTLQNTGNERSPIGRSVYESIQFDKKRYTDKVLNQIERSMPGVLRRSQDEILMQNNFINKFSISTGKQGVRNVQNKQSSRYKQKNEIYGHPLSLEDHLKRKEHIYNRRYKMMQESHRSSKERSKHNSKKNSPRKEGHRRSVSRKRSNKLSNKDLTDDRITNINISKQSETAKQQTDSTTFTHKNQRKDLRNKKSKSTLALDNLNKLSQEKLPKIHNAAEYTQNDSMNNSQSKLKNLNIDVRYYNEKEVGFKKMTSMPNNNIFENQTQDIKSMNINDMHSQMMEQNMRKPMTNEMIRRPKKAKLPYHLNQALVEPHTATHQDNDRNIFNSKSQHTNIFERGKVSGQMYQIEPAGNLKSNLNSIEDSDQIVPQYQEFENQMKAYPIERRTTEGARRHHKALQPLLVKDSAEGKSAKDMTRDIEFRSNLFIFDDRQKQNISNLENKSELPSQGGSMYLRRFEELSKQKKNLDHEEEELNNQRKNILQERERIAKQLRRIDKKEELVRQEEHVKKQRMILEIDKKQLREDIGELDQLKKMLEDKKKDTAVGFSELAESNKEMKSLKSGELLRERSLIFSKQSMRSKGFEQNGARRQDSTELDKSITPNAGSYASRSGYGQQLPQEKAPQIIDETQKLAKTEKNFTQPLTASEQQDYGQEQYGQEIKQSYQNNNNQAQFNVSYKRIENHNRTTSGKFGQVQQEPYDNGIYQDQQQRPSLPHLDTAIQQSAAPGTDVLESPSFERNNTDNRDREVYTATGSRYSTFLGGTGLFDWANCSLMADVKNSQKSFQGIEGVSTDSNMGIYHENDVIDLCEIYTQNPQALRKQQVAEVFQCALKTLKVLMDQMNQNNLFQLIVHKYQEASRENAIKLLMRAKNLLEARKIAYLTLKNLIYFDSECGHFRKQIETFLEESQNEYLLKQLKYKACTDLPAKAKHIIDSIIQLRDEYKIFNKMEATTSKGNNVRNVMAYKRRDAIRHTMKEYEAIKRLVQVVDIKMPALQI